MGRFVTKIMIYALYCFLIEAVFSYCIDPYNVFHALNIRDNGVEPNKNYIKMEYILHNPDKYDAFMFGSSRVGAIHTEKIPNVRCYNMTYSEGVPEEHLHNIQTMIENSIVPDKIFIGLDSLSYTASSVSHTKQLLRSPYEYLSRCRMRLWSMYLDTRMVVQSLSVIVPYDGQSYSVSKFYDSGVNIDYNVESNYNWKNAKASIGTFDLLDETLDSISKIVELCRQNNIELVIFTNPMHQITYRESVERGWFVFLRKLSDITDFYNFSGINSITSNNNNYYETSHYKAEIGDLIIDCIIDGNVPDALLEQGFGMYVANDNIDQLLELLQKQQDSSLADSTGSS